MLIAHISDTHLRSDGKPLKKKADSRAALELCVGHLRSLNPRPDAVVTTGDLAHTALAEDYRVLRDALGGLEMPVYVVPGNMDDRRELRNAFAHWGYLPDDGEFLHYAVEDHRFRLIGLDTQPAEGHEGTLCGKRLAWLETRLAEQPDRPTLIFMHHPPVESNAGSPAFPGAAEMEAIVVRRPQVMRIACGHLHQRIEFHWAGSVVSVAASVVFTRLGVPPSAPFDPSACPLYQIH